VEQISFKQERKTEGVIDGESKDSEDRMPLVWHACRWVEIHNVCINQIVLLCICTISTQSVL